MVVMMGEDGMVMVKLWLVRSMWEGVLWDAGLIDFFEGIIVRVERQSDAW